MPIYEYTCENCATHFEALVRGQEKPSCPHCSSEKLHKEWSVPAAHVAAAHGNGRAGGLPIASSQQLGGGCGKPQCGMGGCGGI